MRLDKFANIMDEVLRLRAVLLEIAEMPPLQTFNPDGSPATYDEPQRAARLALSAGDHRDVG